MINLMVPNKFDFKLLEEYKKLNEKYSDIKITEQYGSIPNFDSVGSSRENSRLPTMSVSDLVKYIKKSNKYNIKINWTMNSSCLGSLNNIYEIGIKDNLICFEDMGIDRVTVAHPLIMRLVKKYTKLKLEVSTIAHVESISQIKECIEEYDADKICLSLFMNREIKFLRKIKELEYDKYIELMATEFCNYECLYRRFHYNLQSHQKEVEYCYKKWPYGQCTQIKKEEPVEWLKARFILPQWMKNYQKEFDIDKFKITGRTFPSKVILPVVKSYMRQEYKGNLLALWTQLESIGIDEKISKPMYNIDVGKLDVKFLNFWFKKDIDCRLCDGGKYCSHCYTYLKKSLIK